MEAIEQYRALDVITEHFGNFQIFFVVHEDNKFHSLSWINRIVYILFSFQ